MSTADENAAIPVPAPEPGTAKRVGAEAVGTFWLVLGGCGTAVFAAEFVGVLGVALAFGLTVVTGAYAFGHISGAHFNPAVTVGLAVARRFEWAAVPAYVVAQVVGATVGGLIILIVANGVDGFTADGNMATNGYGDHSPAGYALWAVLIAEVVLTAMFVYVILGATAKRGVTAFAGLAIGLCLTLIHLISIPISNTSVNPARSLGVAWFGGSDALVQVWAFILAPLVGAAIGGITHALLTGEPD